MNDPECLNWAIDLLDRGFWPCLIFPPGIERAGQHVPRLTTGKEPIGRNWGHTQKTREELSDLVAWARVEGFRPHGVGICLGPKRAPGGGWLIDIEVDGPKGKASIAKLFEGNSVATCGWSSLRGDHRLFVADGHELVLLLERARAKVDVPAGKEDLELKAEVDEINSHISFIADCDDEVRWQGAYTVDELPDLEFRIGRRFGPNGKPLQMLSVVPPTPNRDGTPRVWNGVDVISDLPQEAYDFLEKVGARVLCLN